MRAKMLLKFGAIACAAVMSLSLFAGCGGRSTEIKDPPKPPVTDPDDPTPGGDPVNTDYPWYGTLASQYNDTSDLPSWDTSRGTLRLKAWNANGTGGFTKYTSSNDVVSPEITRVTGVSIDTANSFDNAGSSIEAMLDRVIMMSDKPDIAYGTHETATIIQENNHALVWDLTDYVETYCPTIMERMPASVWNSSSVNGGEEGKIYGIPFNLGDVGLSTVDPDADPQETIAFEYLQNKYGCVYVRDDILVDLADQVDYIDDDVNTYEDLQEIYATNGEFTEEQLYDVSITSKEGFYRFLRDIADLINTDIAENGTNSRYSMPQGRKVMPILARDGSDRDNWSWGAGLVPLLIGGSGALNTMFSYWDAEDHVVKNMILQDFFEEMLREWAGFIQEGVICNDYGLRTPNSTIQAEMNTGYYAVAYPNCTPADYTATLPSGEQVHYRKVWLQIPTASQFEFFAQSAPVPSSVVIFKDSVRTEAELIMILRWLDYQCSELADKMYGWGPESAGLFTEDANGVRQFKDSNLADQMVYNTSMMGDLVRNYNLSNTTLASAQPTFPFFYQGGSKSHPKCFYDLSSMPSMMDSFFSPAAVDPDNNVGLVNIARRACMWTWSDTDLDGISDVWSKRNTIEGAISTVLLSGTGGFNAAYNNLVSVCTSQGWTDEYFGGAYTDAFLNLNKDYLSNFTKGTGR